MSGFLVTHKIFLNEKEFKFILMHFLISLIFVISPVFGNLVKKDGVT